MPELKNYRLLISHSWKYSTQYDTILEWLNTASNFKWSNHSVSADWSYVKKKYKLNTTNFLFLCNC